MRLSPTPPLVLALLLGTAAAQNSGRPSAYQEALQRAVDAALERALRDVDVHEDHSTWDKAWIVRTDHFLVRTTRSHGEGMHLALGLEKMLQHFQETLDIADAPSQPLHVYVLPDRDAYNQFGEQHGAEHSSFYGSFYADQAPDRPVACVEDPNPLWLRMQLTHSVVHQYLAQVWPDSKPTWVDEGLASYFSIYWDYAWGLAEFERLKASSQLVPLRRLLRDDLSAYGQQTHARFVQLGMLFYYLVRYRDDTRTTLPGEEPQQAPFRDYLRALRVGEDVSAHPVQALLDDPTSLERDLLAFEFPR